MKSKNALYVAGTILFIILYQVFVLGPYTEQKIAFEKAQQEETEAAQAQGGSTSSPQLGIASDQASSETSDTASNTSQASGAVVSDTSKVSPLRNPKKLLDYSVGQDRVIEIYEGGTLGIATLSNYFEREAFVKGVKNPIELNKQGLYWYASHSPTQQCLNSMTDYEQGSSSEGSFLKLSASVNTNSGMGYCEFLLSPDAQYPGLMMMTLKLEGFAASENDIVELRGQGGLGSDNVLDQRFLSYRLEDEIESIRGEDVFLKTDARGLIKWMTWGDKYFSLIFSPRGLYNPNLHFGLSANVDSVDTNSAKTPYALRYPAMPERGKSSFEFVNSFYFGARSTTVLNEIDPELVETVDLGFFASVARLMLWSLETLNTFFLNYGISIIVLTLIVRAIFWPLNKKAYQSQAKMKEIQPEMDRIRKKYDQKDRAQMEQMNKEIFGMYREKKVNPLGGCLPLLLQMPILIGLYGGLSNSIELYQAPFALWIRDLSLPDSYYVLPIVWTLSLLGYMKINPQAMNTTQPGMPNMKWMFIGMNLFFGFLSKDWPAGLVLYLVVSNLVGLTQQYFIQRNIKRQATA